MVAMQRWLTERVENRSESAESDRNASSTCFQSRRDDAQLNRALLSLANEFFLAYGRGTKPAWISRPKGLRRRALSLLGGRQRDAAGLGLAARFLRLDLAMEPALAESDELWHLATQLLSEAADKYGA